MSSIATFMNGLACQKHPPLNDLDKLPVLKIRELSSGISETSDWATSQVKPDYLVEAGDVIFAWSASLMVKVWDGEKCVLNQHLFKVTSARQRLMYEEGRELGRATKRKRSATASDDLTIKIPQLPRCARS